MRRCYISGKKCEFAGQDDGSGYNECLAVFEDVCPIEKELEKEVTNGRGQ